MVMFPFSIKFTLNSFKLLAISPRGALYFEVILCHFWSALCVLCYIMHSLFCSTLRYGYFLYIAGF